MPSSEGLQSNQGEPPHQAQQLHLKSPHRGPYMLPVQYLKELQDALASNQELQEQEQLGDDWRCSIIVFINAKSGSQHGKRLVELLGQVLGTPQVFLLPKQAPDAMTKKLWGVLKAAVKQGDQQAQRVLKSVKIVAAGGDGTISWVLQAVRQAQLEPMPACSVMPLGTGNGVSRSLGWGKSVDKDWMKDTQTLVKYMGYVAGARMRDLDMWRIRMTCNLEQQRPQDVPDKRRLLAQQSNISVGAAVPQVPLPRTESEKKQREHQQEAERKEHQQLEGDFDHPANPSRRTMQRQQESLWLHHEPQSVLGGQLPHALSPDDCDDTQDARAGEFSYYLTVGLDAEAAYRFDRLRNEKPNKAKHRIQNIFWYGFFNIKTGWLCGGKPVTKHLGLLRVKGAGPDAQWQEIKVPKDVRALVIINFQSYSGGRDLWGLHDHRWPEEKAKGFKKPIFDDGLLEVIGLKGGPHTVAVLSQVSAHIHGERLAQAHEVQLELHAAEGMPNICTHMRLDGEAWQQPLPQEDQECLHVHVKHAGTARVLVNTENLPGINKKARKLAEREVKYSTPEADRKHGMDNSQRDSLDSDTPPEQRTMHT